jgi:hypothetical protein
VRLETAPNRHVVERRALPKLFECAAETPAARVRVKSHSVPLHEESPYARRLETARTEVLVAKPDVRLVLDRRDERADPFGRAAADVERVAPAARAKAREKRLPYARKKPNVLGFRLSRGT